MSRSRLMFPRGLERNQLCSVRLGIEHGNVIVWLMGMLVANRSVFASDDRRYTQKHWDKTTRRVTRGFFRLTTLDECHLQVGLLF